MPTDAELFYPKFINATYLNIATHVVSLSSAASEIARANTHTRGRDCSPLCNLVRLPSRVLAACMLAIHILFTYHMSRVHPYSTVQYVNVPSLIETRPGMWSYTLLLTVTRSPPDLLMASFDQEQVDLRHKEERVIVRKSDGFAPT